MTNVNTYMYNFISYLQLTSLSSLKPKEKYTLQMQQRRSEYLARLMPMALRTQRDKARGLQLTVYRSSSVRWSIARALEKPCSSLTRQKGEGDHGQDEGSLPEYSQLPIETNHTGKKTTKRSAGDICSQDFLKSSSLLNSAGVTKVSF